jgi:hypothetical protein
VTGGAIILVLGSFVLGFIAGWIAFAAVYSR